LKEREAKLEGFVTLRQSFEEDIKEVKEKVAQIQAKFKANIYSASQNPEGLLTGRTGDPE